MSTVEPSARQMQLLEAAYQYGLEHGIGDLSLRPLATAIGTSPRVLIYLFGSKDGLVRSLIERARADELAMLEGLRSSGAGDHGFAYAVQEVWAWVSAPQHRAVLVLWVEAYGRSLVDPAGPWKGFARSTVDDWLSKLASEQPGAERDLPDGLAVRTAVLALLRGAMLDLLATHDDHRVLRAFELALEAILGSASSPAPMHGGR